MGDFEFPTNIKQIGSIGDGIRIYIEDYACSYLQQYAEAGGYEERLAFLVGRGMVIDSQTVLFISGLVQGQHTALDKETLCFTDKSWQQAREDINRYFTGLDIVGWMQSQPGYGVYLNENYAGAHKKMFPREDQVMFVIDPVEKLNAFYIYDDKRENLTESRGYFIYYDKNRGMHEYMLDNKIVKAKLRPPSDAAKPAQTPLKLAGERNALSAAARLRALAGDREQPRKPAYSQKRVVNLLVSLSAALFIVCFIMGAGLIQNDGRITSMEAQVTQLNTAYRDLLVQIKDGNVSSVFASQNEPLGAAGTEQNAALADNTPAENAPAENASSISPSSENAAIDNTSDESAAVFNDNGSLLMDESTPPPETTAENANPPQTQELTQLETYMPPAPGEDQASLEPEDLWEDGGGQTGGETAGAPADIPDTYTVREGDSLIYISTKFYGDTSRVKDIMALNGMDDADLIYFGKILKLPK